MFTFGCTTARRDLEKEGSLHIHLYKCLENAWYLSAAHTEHHHHRHSPFRDYFLALYIIHSGFSHGTTNFLPSFWRYTHTHTHTHQRGGFSLVDHTCTKYPAATARERLLDLFVERGFERVGGIFCILHFGVFRLSFWGCWGVWEFSCTLQPQDGRFEALGCTAEDSYAESGYFALDSDTFAS